MEEDVQGIMIFNEKLLHWKNLLTQWLALTTYYCDFMEDDAPYYYTERANIGVLAGAAWKSGWISLEEFGARKRGKRQGRCDLYIYPSNREIGEYIEAKHIYNISQTKPWLDKAIIDAAKLRPYKEESAVKIGVLFITPGIHEKFSSNLIDQINQFIKTAAKISCDIFAYSFPASARELRGGGQYKNIIYPGVLLLAQVVG